MQFARSALLLLILPLAVAYGVGYWLTAQYCYFPPRGAPAVFSTASLMLGLLLLTPRRAWPAILASVVGAHLLVACLLLQRPLSRMVLAMSIDVAEALFAAMALQHWIAPRIDLTRLKHVLGFLAVAVAAAGLGATVRAAVRTLLFNDSFAPGWYSWSCGNLTGLLLVAPVILGWGAIEWETIRQTGWKAFLEGVAVLIAATALAHVGFGYIESQSNWVFHLSILLFLLLIWAALRFHPRLVATAIWLISVVLIVHAVQGRGPFSVADHPTQQVVLGIQALLLLIGLASLLLSSLMAERRRDQAALRESYAVLEQRVADRTAALTETVAQLHTQVIERTRAEAALEHERRTLEHLLRSSDHERQLIAYEIHDGLTQHLSAAIMQLQAYAASRVREGGEAAKGLESGLELLSQSLAEARRLINGVRPPILDEAGIEAAVAHLVDSHRADGVRIDFHSEVEFSRLEPVLENALYRIAQESLTNACRYSRSEKIHVALVQSDGRVRIEIRDWGVGFRPEAVADGCFGLEGIRERARLLGGSASIESESGRGTRIAVELPLFDKRR